MKDKSLLKNKIILAIDTSCDDTSIAITKGTVVLANVSWTKMKLHSDWGGVVPSEAKRQHLEFLDPAIKEALKQAKIGLKDIDYVAVTYGPGLAIALESGIQKAKQIAKEYNKPLIAVNHMIGHLYANLAQDINSNHLSTLESNDFSFPALGVAISGGHTSFYIIKDHLELSSIGETVDDAIGEAFDKVGRMLGMGFPAGAKIEESAKLGDEGKYKFPRPMINSGDYNFSFSGLKTAVLYQIKKITGDYNKHQAKKAIKIEDLSQYLSEVQINDISASFQKAAFDTLIAKLKKAVKEYNPKMLIIGGGVIANKTLRTNLKNTIPNLPMVYPTPIWLCTDNAVMIAMAGLHMAHKGIFVKKLDELDRVPSLDV